MASARSASAALRVLGLVKAVAAQSGESTLTELSQAQGLSRSVASKLLKILLDERLVQYDAQRKTYRAGLGMYLLATSILHKTSLVQISREIMRDLVERTNESACLNLLDRDKEAFTVAAVEESVEHLQYVIETGKLHPLHAGASGKAILAFQPDDFVLRVLSRELPRITKGTLTDAVKLKAQLAKIRQVGYSISQGERLEGAVGIAAPVFDHSGCAVGSVQLTIPHHRYRPADLPRFSEAVSAAADLISAAAQALHGGQ